MSATYDAIGIVAQGPSITYPSGSAAKHVRDVMAKLIPLAEPMEILNMLRADGWAVGCHNDYFLAGEHHTFYLFTHRHYGWVKGEGATDLEALKKACMDANMAVEIWREKNPR